MTGRSSPAQSAWNRNAPAVLVPSTYVLQIEIARRVRVLKYDKAPTANERRSEVGVFNLERVRGFFEDHPGCEVSECAVALGLSRRAVSQHVGRLRAEWSKSAPLETKGYGQ